MSLPEYGWAYRTPQAPTRICRWCGAPHVVHNGIIACRRCDQAVNRLTGKPIPGLAWLPEDPA